MPIERETPPIPAMPDEPAISHSWRFFGPDSKAVGRLQSEFGLSPTLASIVLARGLVSDAEISAFLDPSLSRLNNPFLFKDMEAAAARVAQAIAMRESTCIYGDYDADGMTSTALLKLFLAELGLDARTFLPDREADGYGLNTERLAELAASGTRLVICVDCGIKAVDAVEFAGSLGMDLVILDHHMPGTVLPRAVAVVDPHRHDCPFPFKDLAAVGISFYFCGALRRHMIDTGRLAAPGPDIRQFLDLVAIGTVADVMPLLQDNRILVRAGLERMNGAPRPGIAALRSVSEIRGPITSGSISFRMAPRLNASGRMSHPDTSLSLLVAGDDREAAAWADRLNVDNSLRREVGAQVLEEARRAVLSERTEDSFAIVAAGEGWHPGVLGIVAARLVEEFRVPSIVLSIDGGIATGSGRSVEGFDLGAALAELDRMLLRNGGHPMAAGLSLKMTEFDDFAREFKAIAALRLGGRTQARILDIDAIVTIDVLNNELLAEISSLEPFGIRNREPVLAASGVKIVQARRGGRDGSHLKLQFEQNGTVADGIWFGGADCGLRTGMTVDVAFCLSPDLSGMKPSMKIQDVRI